MPSGRSSRSHWCWALLVMAGVAAALGCRNRKTEPATAQPTAPLSASGGVALPPISRLGGGYDPLRNESGPVAAQPSPSAAPSVSSPAPIPSLLGRKAGGHAC